MVICLVRGTDLHMAQRIPLPLTVSCSSKIQIGFTFLVPAHPGIVPDRGPLNGVCVTVSLSCTVSEILALISQNFKRSRDPDGTPILQIFNMCNGTTLYVQSANQFEMSRNGSCNPDQAHLVRVT